MDKMAWASDSAEAPASWRSPDQLGHVAAHGGDGLAQPLGQPRVAERLRPHHQRDCRQLSVRVAHGDRLQQLGHHLAESTLADIVGQCVPQHRGDIVQVLRGDGDDHVLLLRKVPVDATVRISGLFGLTKANTGIRFFLVNTVGFGVSAGTAVITPRGK
jgi:hypothetical protein